MIAEIARAAPRSPSPRRRHGRGCKAKPSSRIAPPCARTRVATTTSKPSARAARATGSRCEQKYQSSVTRNRSFGRRVGSGRAIRVEAVLLGGRRLFNASAPRLLAQSGSRRSDRGRNVRRILVTGAAGFIGRALCRGLAERGHWVLGLTRLPAEPVPGVELRAAGQLGPQTSWPQHLAGIDLVIHLADRGTEAAAPRAAAALARAAAVSGVRRLVHMSSIRAMGEATR